MSRCQSKPAAPSTRRNPTAYASAPPVCSEAIRCHHRPLQLGCRLEYKLSSFAVQNVRAFACSPCVRQFHQLILFQSHCNYSLLPTLQQRHLSDVRVIVLSVGDQTTVAVTKPRCSDARVEIQWCCSGAEPVKLTLPFEMRGCLL